MENKCNKSHLLENDKIVQGTAYHKKCYFWPKYRVREVQRGCGSAIIMSQILINITCCIYAGCWSPQAFRLYKICKEVQNCCFLPKVSPPSSSCKHTNTPCKRFALLSFHLQFHSCLLHTPHILYILLFIPTSITHIKMVSFCKGPLLRFLNSVLLFTSLWSILLFPSFAHPCIVPSAIKTVVTLLVSQI